MSCFFITGTDTDVGKTVVTALLVAYFKQQGKNVIPYKPIQSGGINKEGKLVAPDLQVYQWALPELKMEEANHYLFKLPTSPHLAARAEGGEILMAEIIDDYQALKQKYEMVLVEGAGGLIVPLNDEGDCILHLIQEIAVPVILVARSGVGTINHTVLSVMAMKYAGIKIAGIILNRLQAEASVVEQENQTMIEMLTGVPVLGIIPFIENVEDLFKDAEELRKVLANLQMDKIKELERVE